MYGNRGASISSQTYCGGTLFCDAASGKIRVVHQVSLNAHETVAAKHTFEREARMVGVEVKAYRTDNGVYTSKEFTNELEQEGQGIKHSGVGGHHHNGVAENAIKNVQRKARTMMIHAALRWPDQSERQLWPLALDYAVYLHNHTPREATGLSPEKIWTRSKSSHSALQHARVWGCPVYVLDPRLQDGKKIPKWEPRSRRGQFVGFSPLHASSVGIIRNLRTNNLSPQFHVVYDNFFKTVHSTENEVPNSWEDLVTFSSDRVLDVDDDEYIPELPDEWVDDATKEYRRHRRMERRNARRHPDDPREPEPEPAPGPVDAPEGVNYPILPNVPEDDDLPEEQPPVRRGTRPRYPVDRYVPGTSGLEQAHQLVYKLTKAAMASVYPKRDYALVYALLTDPDYVIVDAMLLHVQNQMSHLFKANKSDPDSPNLGEALRGPHSEDFLEAMKSEIISLEEHDTWTVIRKTSVPEGANVLPGTWVFKIKRFPDGRYRKTKARFCVRGDRQIEGVDYFDTYAPVVSWSTVRLLLCLSISNGWKTRQVDFSNAFVQAKLKEDVYISLPAMFKGPQGEGNDKVVLKLNRSLYGLV